VSVTNSLLTYLERSEIRTTCWMTSNPMNDVLNPNAIPENERWWDVGIIFRRNEQSYAD
jgi:hypothetical protein